MNTHVQVDQTSYDFLDEDKDPSNQYPWHGTSCGGIIGAVKDEETCGLGIAYNCNLGGKYISLQKMGGCFKY